MHQLHQRQQPDSPRSIRDRRILILAIFAALFAHVCVFLALAQIVFFFTQEDEAEIVFAARLVDLPAPLPKPAGVPRVPEAALEVKAPAKAEAELDPARPEPEIEKTAAPKTQTAQVGRATAPASLYAARSNTAGKAKALRQFGGTPGSEQAVQMALEWLARNQTESGEWTGGQPGTEPALTGLALMAFLGAGYGPTQGKFVDTVKRAIERLVNMQDQNGLMGPSSRHEMYCHGIATLALAEAANMTPDRVPVPVLKQAVACIVAAQQPGGGWDYRRQQTDRNDTSVACWQIMALMSAKRTGKVTVPAETIRGAIQHLERATMTSGRVKYLPTRKETSPALTAAALFCRLLLGWDSTTTIARRSAACLRPHLPKWSQAGQWPFPQYFWYYGTLAMFQMGPPYWTEWNSAMREMLVKHQRRKGDERGSWDPLSSGGNAGGRAYSTALNCLDLEVYYRYLPLYKLRGAAAVTVLAAELLDAKGRVRSDVVSKLIGVGSASAAALTKVLPQCGEQTKTRIVQFLCSRPMTPDIRNALAGCIDERDPLWADSEFTRVKAAGALAVAGHLTALGPLRELASHANDFIRSQAIDALACYDTPDALAVLIDALADSQTFIVKKALTALLRHSQARDFGLAPDEPTESREEAIRKWREWLADRRASNSVQREGDPKAPEAE